MIAMRPCPFCGEKRRNTVIVKTLRNASYYGTFAAYGYCRACKARGTLVKHNDTHDIRHDRITPEMRSNLVERAIQAWNGDCKSLNAEELPLFGAKGDCQCMY